MQARCTGGTSGNKFLPLKLLNMDIKPYWLQIHRALHSHASSVTVGSATYPVQVSSNGCRCIKGTDRDLGKITIMEQNPNKISPYASRARAGETLSWVIPDKGGKWILIDEPIAREVTL